MSARRWPLALLLVVLLGRAWGEEPPRGHLVIVGGGGVPAAVCSAALELCPAPRRVLIVPQASRLPDRGQDAAALWRAAGAGEVRVLDPLPAELPPAELVWLGGGDQSRLRAALAEAGLLDALRARYREGLVIGGTSAGAAVMGRWMLTGQAELERLAAGTTELTEGAGLWPEALVDQHFLARRRHNRLLSAVLDRPRLLGVGIDERTAVIVSGDRLRVLGESCVTVYDARRARVAASEAGQPPAGQGLALHVLRAGDALTWR